MLALLCAVAVFATAVDGASGLSLPARFPVKGIFSLNPDQITADNCGTGTFKVAKPGGNADEYDEIEVKGHRWATSLRLRPDVAGRVAFSLPVEPDGRVEALRQARRQGASALCPEAPALPPKSALSAATHPHRP